jgi:GNAT superfamily N-acetyltransferase
MRIERLDIADKAAIGACHEVLQATLAVDDPLGPPLSLRMLRNWLEHPVEPAESWYVPGDTAGEMVAWCHLILHAPENLDRAMLFVEVRPPLRRRGIGGALLRHSAQRAARDGRSVLTGWALEGAAGESFALRAGATPGLLDARRVLVLGRIPAGRIAALRESAARAAAGYSLVCWSGRVPDEHLAGYAGVENAMNDRPRDAGEQARVWDARRVREQVNDLRERQGRHIYTLAALHAASGEMAAFTEVEADPTTAEWGHQLATLVKTAMLDWLATAEPALERIVTGNAAVNQHMIAINEALGYELLEPQVRTYELAVADVPGAA